jgi:hypothetical protein
MSDNRAHMSDLVFFAVLASTVALVWIFPVFPTQDGPAHLENARLLVELLRGNPEAQRFFSFDRFSPNWVSHLVLAPLLLIVPAAIAEKIVLTIATVLPPLGFRKALDALGGRRVLALLALPFAHSFLLTMGFLNFCVAVGVALFVVAHWSRPNSSTVRTAIGLTLTYFLHPVAFVYAAAMLAAMALVRGRAWWGRTALSMLPGIVLVFVFLGGHESTESGGGPERWSLFSTLGVLVSFTPTERTLSTFLWILLGAVAVFEAGRLPWKRSWRDGVLLATVPFLVLTFVAPFFLAGGAYVPERFLFCGALTLTLWIGMRAPGELLPPILGSVAASIAVAMNLVRVPVLRERNDQIADYTSIAEALPSGALVLPLNGSMAGERHDGSISVTKVDSMRHAIGYLAVSRGVIDLANYQPNTGHFPLRWNESVAPFGRLFSRADLEQVPPRVDLLRYERETGIAVDAVLLWDFVDRSKPEIGRVYADLEQGGYSEVARSESGRTTVWARR